MYNNDITHPSKVNQLRLEHMRKFIMQKMKHKKKKKYDYVLNWVKQKEDALQDKRADDELNIELVMEKIPPLKNNANAALKNMYKLLQKNVDNVNLKGVEKIAKQIKAYYANMNNPPPPKQTPPPKEAPKEAPKKISSKQLASKQSVPNEVIQEIKKESEWNKWVNKKQAPPPKEKPKPTQDTTPIDAANVVKEKVKAPTRTYTHEEILEKRIEILTKKKERAKHNEEVNHYEKEIQSLLKEREKPKETPPPPKETPKETPPPPKEKPKETPPPQPKEKPKEAPLNRDKLIHEIESHKSYIKAFTGKPGFEAILRVATSQLAAAENKLRKYEEKHPQPKDKPTTDITATNLTNSVAINVKNKPSTVSALVNTTATNNATPTVTVKKKQTPANLAPATAPPSYLMFDIANLKNNNNTAQASGPEKKLPQLVNYNPTTNYGKLNAILHHVADAKGNIIKPKGGDKVVVNAGIENEQIKQLKENIKKLKEAKANPVIIKEMEDNLRNAKLVVARYTPLKAQPKKEETKAEPKEKPVEKKKTNLLLRSPIRLNNTPLPKPQTPEQYKLSNILKPKEAYRYPYSMGPLPPINTLMASKPTAPKPLQITNLINTKPQGTPQVVAQEIPKAKGKGKNRFLYRTPLGQQVYEQQEARRKRAERIAKGLKAPDDEEKPYAVPQLEDVAGWNKYYQGITSIGNRADQENTNFLGTLANYTDLAAQGALYTGHPIAGGVIKGAATATKVANSFLKYRYQKKLEKKRLKKEQQLEAAVMKREAARKLEKKRDKRIERMYYMQKLQREHTRDMMQRLKEIKPEIKFDMARYFERESQYRSMYNFQELGERFQKRWEEKDQRMAEKGVNQNPTGVAVSAKLQGLTPEEAKRVEEYENRPETKEAKMRKSDYDAMFEAEYNRPRYVITADKSGMVPFNHLLLTGPALAQAVNQELVRRKYKEKNIYRKYDISDDLKWEYGNGKTGVPYEKDWGYLTLTPLEVENLLNIKDPSVKEAMMNKTGYSFIDRPEVTMQQLQDYNLAEAESEAKKKFMFQVAKLGVTALSAYFGNIKQLPKKVFKMAQTGYSLAKKLKEEGLTETAKKIFDRTTEQANQALKEEQQRKDETGTTILEQEIKNEQEMKEEEAKREEEKEILTKRIELAQNYMETALEKQGRPNMSLKELNAKAADIRYWKEHKDEIRKQLQEGNEVTIKERAIGNGKKVATKVKWLPDNAPQADYANALLHKAYTNQNDGLNLGGWEGYELTPERAQMMGFFLDTFGHEYNKDYKESEYTEQEKDWIDAFVNGNEASLSKYNVKYDDVFDRTSKLIKEQGVKIAADIADKIQTVNEAMLHSTEITKENYDQILKAVMSNKEELKKLKELNESKRRERGVDFAHSAIDLIQQHYDMKSDLADMKYNKGKYAMKAKMKLQADDIDTGIERLVLDLFKYAKDGSDKIDPKKYFSTDSLEADLAGNQMAYNFAAKVHEIGIIHPAFFKQFLDENAQVHKNGKIWSRVSARTNLEEDKLRNAVLLKNYMNFIMKHGLPIVSHSHGLIETTNGRRNIEMYSKEEMREGIYKWVKQNFIDDESGQLYIPGTRHLGNIAKNGWEHRLNFKRTMDDDIKDSVARDEQLLALITANPMAGHALSKIKKHNRKHVNLNTIQFIAENLVNGTIEDAQKLGIKIDETLEEKNPAKFMSKAFDHVMKYKYKISFDPKNEGDENTIYDYKNIPDLNWNQNGHDITAVVAKDNWLTKQKGKDQYIVYLPLHGKDVNRIKYFDVQNDMGLDEMYKEEYSGNEKTAHIFGPRRVVRMNEYMPKYSENFANMMNYDNMQFGGQSSAPPVEKAYDPDHTDYNQPRHEFTEQNINNGIAKEKPLEN